MPIAVRLPDDSLRELPDGATGTTLAESIGPRLAEAALGIRVNGGVVLDLMTPLHDGEKVAIVTNKDPDSLEVIRHSAAHLMAQAATSARSEDRSARTEIRVLRWRSRSMTEASWPDLAGSPTCQSLLIVCCGTRER